MAMSGGVDSSVAAALLKKQGYDVTGVFIKIEVAENCAWRTERRDAMRAAAALQLPFLTFDLSAAYERSVIDYLVREYRAGRTPNPDVRCNRQIKFGEFFAEARRRGADLIATGHYAGIRRDNNFATHGQQGKAATKSLSRLLTAKDKEKDQTYFLWTIKQEILTRCLFPIGAYRKTEVRRLAKKFGLPNAAKPDSQGLCFLGEIDFKNFLAARLPEKTGLVLSEAGKVIGEHRGAHFYTIGERHGFKVNPKLTLPVGAAGRLPFYVVAKDVTKNTITVGSSAQRQHWAVKEINLNETNWLTDPPRAGKNYLARTRYRAPLVHCQVIIDSKNNRAKIIFTEPQTGLAPGQSCVIYDQNICLGGGVII